MAVLSAASTTSFMSLLSLSWKAGRYICSIRVDGARGRGAYFDMHPWRGERVDGMKSKRFWRERRG
eukprot:scaffold9142_cov144-Skeletonema_menzelii.AAC.3